LAEAPTEGSDRIMSSIAADPAVSRQPLIHDGLLYRTSADFLAGVLPFLHAGLADDQPALVAVPEPNLTLLRDGLDGGTDHVEFVDMTRIGRNPARIVLTIHRFVDAHPLSRVRFVGEPMWPGRSDAEVCEATRHEAMLNAAFADSTVDLLCPYDVSQLDPDVVAGAWRTHPTVVEDARRRTSPHFTDPRRLYTGDEPPLPDPPDHVAVVSVSAGDLAGIRSFLRHYAADIGLGSRRTQDLVLAVNEIATNSILYTPGSGVLRIWAEPQAVICEIHDSGFITDAFVGRRPPNEAADHGRGLWMANELCDLVQLRSTAAGTTVRVHVDRPSA
jgi:anti-sigma regulatory factor (Ser/Thr protein kinase)